jgi:hypothetical protein
MLIPRAAKARTIRKNRSPFTETDNVMIPLMGLVLRWLDVGGTMSRPRVEKTHEIDDWTPNNDHEIHTTIRPFLADDTVIRLRPLINEPQSRIKNHSLLVEDTVTRSHPLIEEMAIRTKRRRLGIEVGELRRVRLLHQAVFPHCLRLGWWTHLDVEETMKTLLRGVRAEGQVALSQGGARWTTRRWPDTLSN